MNSGTVFSNQRSSQQGYPHMNCFKKRFAYVSTACFCFYATGSPALAAPFQINTATGLFAPGFRDTASTTWFGWGYGSFDPDLANEVGELIASPPQTLNALNPPVGYNLVQNTTNDIISGSNNIYTGSFNLDLTLTTPTSGTLGVGFTTIIAQGNTAFGDFPSDVSEALAFNGPVTPTYVQGVNANGSGQFWVKYEIPGNAASYDLGITSNSGPISLAGLVVDTQWSATGFAPDLAIVPEPASLALLAIGMGSLMYKYRQRNRQRIT
jgi:hypothetical protein